MNPTNMPHIFSVVPFVVLLTMIATGPVVYPAFWHRYYRYIAVGLALTVVGYYVFFLGAYGLPLRWLAEYVQFIVLIAALYMVAGNVLIRFGCRATARNNVGILWAGALLANVLGTTGASMLLIRPYMELNRDRLRAYHVVFFIFMVSNVGGALTPMADPPLFIGFLKGVPFFWMLKYGLLPWGFALLVLGGTFYWLDASNKAMTLPDAGKEPMLQVEGKRYVVLFLVIVMSLFLDPNQLSWVPAISLGGHRISFIRELILFGVIVGVYMMKDEVILKKNGFSLEPLAEVVFVFIGIFGTMGPAIDLIGGLAKEWGDWITPSSLYWSTGVLSSVLDNAPTYLNFLAAGMSAKGLHVEEVADVVAYSSAYSGALQATSMAAVFFGAMTYVGNGPNFMVRAIAQERGLKMPSFFGYIGRFACVFLLPVLVVVWGVFVFWGIGGFC